MDEYCDKDIILASASTRRIVLLKKILPSLKIVPANIEEIPLKGENYENFTKRISVEKAVAVSRQFSSALIIAADTVVVLDDTFFGKPANMNEAKKMLERLSGRKHSVYTSVSVLDIPSEKIVTDIVCTEVYMDSLTEEEIDCYVKSLEPLDKAGGYGIQDIASLFIEKIDGDYFNVMGIPLSRLKKILEGFDINLVKIASSVKKKATEGQKL